MAKSSKATTEATWRTCTEPSLLLDVLKSKRSDYRFFVRASGKISERKLRLLACACGRRFLDLVEDKRIEQAIEAAEKHAAGSIKPAGFSAARRGAEAAYQVARRQRGPLAFRQWKVTILAVQAAAAKARFDPKSVDGLRGAKERKEKTERKACCELIRDIFGNPFSQVGADPSWLVWNRGTVVHLAQAIYDERAFDRLPILADALEDAGCHDADILEHCRGPGPHVRGCWVVDLLLAKE